MDLCFSTNKLKTNSFIGIYSKSFAQIYLFIYAFIHALFRYVIVL